MYASKAQEETVRSARKSYPDRKRRDPVEEFRPKLLAGEEQDKVTRRIPGFGLNLKVFETTSIKLPVSAYTIFVELHVGHNDVAYTRCFNGLHTVFDLKKWIFEKMRVPMNAYDLSYAEPG